MEQTDVIRAWKDPVYRSGLSRDELAVLPAHPAGLIELRAEDLKSVPSGIALTTAIDCTEFTFRNWRRCCP
ncbi:MAG TPA: mersacidin/lichenicidin family type 2 lantibiotic [Thermoanaerobaculia bacterium]|jgi:mersacidin/lichenicidin family type 2 lantibiotic|nr:mersacidin/lichenicidin family type 2 lantibiotic [Thermoanaerobaculia bacterium]